LASRRLERKGAKSFKESSDQEKRPANLAREKSKRDANAAPALESDPPPPAGLKKSQKRPRWVGSHGGSREP